MNLLAKTLKHNRWAVFLAQQAILFVIGVAFLSVVRILTGKTLKGGRDPIGPADGAAYLLLLITVIIITRRLYYWVEGKDAPPLGLALSLPRLRNLLIGLLIGSAFNSWTWLAGITFGTAAVRDQISSHYDEAGMVYALSVGISIGFANSLLEETTSRAFPIRLWAHRSLIFRMLVPSIFFAAQHLVDGRISLMNFTYLVSLGVILSAAYALTGNIWLGVGLHTGYFLASVALSGLWHMGAVVAVRGQPLVSIWILDMLLLAIAIGLLIVLSQWKKQLPPAPCAV